MRHSIIIRARHLRTRRLGVLSLFALIVCAACGASNAGNSTGDGTDAGGDGSLADANGNNNTDGAPKPGTDGGSSDGGNSTTGSLLPVSQQAYIKASNTAFNTAFGNAVALSADGTTLAVGSGGESSGSTGVNGDQTGNAALDSGAVYIFVRAGTTWTQQAYIKASNSRLSGAFGTSVTLSADGNSLAVGAVGDSSSATGVNGSQADSGFPFAGAVYVFNRTGTTWAQTAYLKSPYTAKEAYFGSAVAFSADGTTLAAAARDDENSEIGINPSTDGGTDDVYEAGAVTLFVLNGGTWSVQAFIKAVNTRAAAEFGWSIALDADGNTLAVGAPFENSDATGINGDASAVGAINSGAVYTFTRAGTTWSQEAYIKAAYTSVNADFGYSVSLSSDGNTLAVGSEGESSNAKGVGGDQTDTSAATAGAAFVFTRAASTWTQQAYIKASNTTAGYTFGNSTSLSGDGNTLVVGSYSEASDATGVNGNQTDTSAQGAGAAYAFTRNGTTWAQVAYIKASNPRKSAIFGESLAISSDGNILAVGSDQETSDATGINGNQADTSLGAAGAVYVFQ